MKILLLYSLSITLMATEMIAHRGASKLAPENTISAIKLAESMNCPFIEIDIHMTKDGEVVALHDSTIDRTTNGSGEIAKLTYQEIKDLDAGSWFSSKYSKEKIPLLSQVLDQIKKSQVIIEFKYGQESYPGIVSKVVKLVKDRQMEKQVILKSFDREVLKEFKAIAPSLRRLYVTIISNFLFTIDNGLRLGPMTKVLDVDYYQVHHFFLNKSLIDQVHKMDKKIIVWDVNTKDKAHHFIKLNVDFIETDDLHLF